MEESEQIKSIQRIALINAATFTQEVSAECIVPDYMPDVERILLTDGKLQIRSAVVSGGRIELEGMAEGTILYVGEGDDTPRKMEFSVPISLSGSDTDLDDTDKLFINARINAAEGKALNSRKLSFRAEAAVCVYAFRENTADLSCKIDDADGAEILWETAEAGYLSGMQERSFTVSEELTLTNEQDAVSDILLYDLSVESGEIRKVGGKMILQGNAELSVLFKEEESGQLRSDRFRIPFSQITDAPEEDLSACIVSLVPSSCRVEPYAGINGAKSIDAEVRLTARILTAALVSVSCAADAYCPRCLCVTEKGSADLWEECGVSVLRQQIKESLRVSDPAGEILYTKGECSVPFMVGNAVRVPVNCCVVYKTQEGKTFAAAKRLQVDFGAPKEDADAVCFGDASCFLSAGISASDQIELRAEVRIPVMTAKQRTVQYLSSVSLDRSSVIHLEEKPSVMAVRPNGRSLWKLAKEYSSTMDLISAANPEPAQENPIVLIPRAR